jgi:hypothetical protein
VERRLETFVVLDDTIDVGLVGGGHADGERHVSTLVLRSIHLGLDSTSLDPS